VSPSALHDPVHSTRRLTPGTRVSRFIHNVDARLHRGRDNRKVLEGNSAVQSLTRAMDVLFAVAHADTPPTVGGLSARLRLPRSTVHRMLDTLVSCGVVARTGHKGYVITPKLALATSANPTTASLAYMIDPHLHSLVALSEETSSLHVRVGDLRVCVAEVEGSRGIRWARGAGWNAPIWAGAVGRMLMAGLGADDLDAVVERSEFRKLARNTVTDKTKLVSLISEARSQGWSASQSETVDGAAAVAAPIAGAGGRTIAVLSLYASADRVDHMKSFVPQLCATAAEAEAEWDAMSAFPRGLTAQDDVQSAE